MMYVVSYDTTKHNNNMYVCTIYHTPTWYYFANIQISPYGKCHHTELPNMFVKLI